jgi:curved DNA-binding protein CbpA
MGNQQSSRTNTYQQYYNSLKNNEPIQLPSNITPYEILGLNKNFSWDELKDAYKRQAKLVHPDKGGTEQLFNLVTEAFKKLAYEYKLKEQDKQHYELKKNYQHQQPLENNYKPPVSNDGNFQDKFNRLFDENRFEPDENERGYGDVMTESSKTREEINVPKVMNSYNKNKFHELFEKQEPINKEVVIYKEPEALVLGKKLNFTEIGGTVDDFSTDATKKVGLQYTDYMKAHTMNRLVDPRSVQTRKEYKNVDDYEADRANITNNKLTPEEIAEQNRLKLKQEKDEINRIKRAQYKDERIEKHYNKVSQLYIQ